MKNNQVLVPFAGTQIMVIDDGADRPVPMKELVEGIKMKDGSKLGWEPMRKLIARDEVLNSVTSIMEVTANDGKNYQSLTLPMKYLPGFFFKINVKNYDGELKKLLIKYQMDCYDVLYNHFHKGFTLNMETFKNWIDKLSLWEKFELVGKLGDLLKDVANVMARPEWAGIKTSFVRPHWRRESISATVSTAPVAPATSKKTKAQVIAEMEADGVIDKGIGMDVLKVDEMLRNVRYVDDDVMNKIKPYMTTPVIDYVCNALPCGEATDLHNLLTDWVGGKLASGSSAQRLANVRVADKVKPCVAEVRKKVWERMEK